MPARCESSHCGAAIWRHGLFIMCAVKAEAEVANRGNLCFRQRICVCKWLLLLCLKLQPNSITRSPSGKKLIVSLFNKNLKCYLKADFYGSDLVWITFDDKTQPHAHTDKVRADLNTHLHPSKTKLQVEHILKMYEFVSVLTYCGCRSNHEYPCYSYIYTYIYICIKQIIHQATRLVVIVIIFIVVSGSGVDSQPEDRYPEWQSNLTRTHLNPERKKQRGQSDRLHWNVFKAYVSSLK